MSLRSFHAFEQFSCNLCQFSAQPLAFKDSQSTEETVQDARAAFPFLSELLFTLEGFKRTAYGLLTERNFRALNILHINSLPAAMPALV